MLNINKLIAVVTTLCFIETSVIAPATQAMTVPPVSPKNVQSVLDGMFIPSTVGRVTGGKYFGSGTVVISIQDLHCHAEVQRNISRILEELDTKYKLQTVYLEGGYGDIDTSWLANIKDQKYRQELVEAMVDSGRLTGAEYYAVLKDRPGLLKGLEDEPLHRANVARLGKILEKKPYFEAKLRELDKDAAFMEAKYFSDRNRRFNKAIEQYKAGKLPAEKYYALLGKYVETINAHRPAGSAAYRIRMENYPHIDRYIELLRTGKRLPYKRIAPQLQRFVGELKQRLPYNSYRYLLDRTENFTRLDKLYVLLSALSREYHFDLSREYPDLAAFFAYIDRGQDINPVEMIREEKRLVEEIRMGFAGDISELEVSFATDFYGYFKDYLFNRLAADDYRYFTERFGKFREIWAKYTYVNRLEELAPEFALLDEYYRVNDERNRIFLDRILRGTVNVGEAAPACKDLDGQIGMTVRSLDSAPEIVVVVAGGFHTEGMDKLLSQRGISYISITPNVTQDTAQSSRLYEQLASHQALMTEEGGSSVHGALSRLLPSLQNSGNPALETAKSLISMDFKQSDALGLTVASSQPGMEKFREAAEAEWRKIARTNHVLDQDKVQELLMKMGIDDITVQINEKTILLKDKDGKTIAEVNRSTGRFIDEESRQPVDGVTKEKMNELVDIERIAHSVEQLSAWIFNQPEQIQISNLFPQMVTVLLWMADQNFLVGDGPVYELLNKKNIAELALAFRAAPENIDKLPPSVQHAMLELVENSKAIKQSMTEEKNDLLKALLFATHMLGIDKALKKGSGKDRIPGQEEDVNIQQSEIVNGTIFYDGNRESAVEYFRRMLPQYVATLNDKEADLSSRTATIQNILFAYEHWYVPRNILNTIDIPSKDYQVLYFLLGLPRIYLYTGYIRRILSMGDDEASRYWHKVFEFEQAYEEVNTNKKNPHRIFKRFSQSYLPIALLLDYVSPGTISNLTSLLKLSIKNGKNNPAVVIKLIESKGTFFDNEQLLKLFKYAYRHIKTIAQNNRNAGFSLLNLNTNGAGKKVNLSINSSRFSAVMTILNSIVFYKDSKSLYALIDSFSSTSKNADTVTDELYNFLTVWSLKEILDIDVSSLRLDILNERYVPYLSRLLEAMISTRRLSSDTGVTLFKATVKATFTGGFWDFIEEEDQNDAIGKEIVAHNRTVRGLMKDAGIDVGHYLGRKTADRLRPEGFDLNGRSFKIRPIVRESANNLFIGDLTDNCLAMNSNIYPLSMIYRLIDEGVNIIEVVDDNGMTMAALWLYITDNGSLVIQNIEISEEYDIAGIKEVVADNMINYALKFSRHVNAQRLLIGFADDGKFLVGEGNYVEELQNSKQVNNHTSLLTKIGGYFQNGSYHLDSVGKSLSLVVAAPVKSISTAGGRQLSRNRPLTLYKNRWFGRFAGENAVTNMLDEVFLAPFRELQLFSELLLLYVNDREAYDRDVRAFVIAHGYGEDEDVIDGVTGIVSFAARLSDIRTGSSVPIPAQIALVLAHAWYNVRYGSHTSHRRPLALPAAGGLGSDLHIGDHLTPAEIADRMDTYASRNPALKKMQDKLLKQTKNPEKIREERWEAARNMFYAALHFNSMLMVSLFVLQLLTGSLVVMFLLQSIAGMFIPLPVALASQITSLIILSISSFAVLSVLGGAIHTGHNLSKSEILAHEAAALLGMKDFRRQFDASERSRAVMKKLRAAGVNDEWDNPSYWKIYRKKHQRKDQGLEIVDEPEDPITITKKAIRSFLLSDGQPGKLSGTLIQRHESAAAIAEEQAELITGAYSGELTKDEAIALLNSIKDNVSSQSTKGMQGIDGFIKAVSEGARSLPGDIEVSVWQRDPWIDLSYEDEFDDCRFLGGKYELAGLGLIKNKSVSFLDFSIDGRRKTQAVMAAGIYTDGKGRQKSVLLIDSIQDGRKTISSSHALVVKKAIEDYAAASGFSRVLYNRDVYNTASREFVQYVRESGATLEELGIALADADSRQYLEAFNTPVLIYKLPKFVQDVFKAFNLLVGYFAYPRGKVAGYAVDLAPDSVSQSAAAVVNEQIDPGKVVVEKIEPGQWNSIRNEILAVENGYDPHFRNNEDQLRNMFNNPASIAVVARYGGRIVGYTTGRPLEHFGWLAGVKHDKNYGRFNTFYEDSIVILPDYQRKGIGTRLENELFDAVREKYDYLTAHRIKDIADEKNYTVLKEFGNWYGSGKPFEYSRVVLRRRWFSAFLGKNLVSDMLAELFVAPVKELGRLSVLLELYLFDREKYAAEAAQFAHEHGYTGDDHAAAVEGIDGIVGAAAKLAGSPYSVKAALLTTSTLIGRHALYNLRHGSHTSHRRPLALPAAGGLGSDLNNGDYILSRVQLLHDANADMESRTTAMQDLLKAYAGGKLSPHDQEIIGNELRDDRRLAFLLDLPDLYFSRDYIKKIVGMDMSEFNGYQERADEFWRIFNEVNRNASDAQRVYKDFGRYIPVALLMDYIVPGAIRTMTGLLRTTIKSGKYNPQIVTRLIDGKRRVIMDEQMLLELEKVRDEIKETVQKNRKKEIKKRVSSTNKRKQKRIPALITMGKNGKKQRTEKKKPGTKVVDIKISNDRFYKIMDIAEGFVALNAAQSVDEVLGSFSSDAKEVNTVIDELHAKMTARFIELLARELDLDATNIPQTVKDKMYIPYMSRLTAARSRIEQREKKVKFLWFTGVVRSMMEGRDRFWKFIEDVDQDDQVGKAIASHNKKIRDLMADRKIDVARYLGREGKDRFAQGTFEHEGRTFTMRPILRDPGHDLFIGDFTNCCLAMNSDLNPEAMIERLIDEGMNVIEVLDDKGQTMAALWLYIAADGSLVVQNIEIAASYEVSNLREPVADKMIGYAYAFSQYINASRLLIGIPSHGKYYGPGNYVEKLYKNNQIFQVNYNQGKIGGYLKNIPYFLDSTKKPKAYFVPGPVETGRHYSRIARVRTIAEMQWQGTVRTQGAIRKSDVSKFFKSLGIFDVLIKTKGSRALLFEEEKQDVVAAEVDLSTGKFIDTEGSETAGSLNDDSTIRTAAVLPEQNAGQYYLDRLMGMTPDEALSKVAEKESGLVVLRPDKFIRGHGWRNQWITWTMFGSFWFTGIALTTLALRVVNPYYEWTDPLLVLGSMAAAFYSLNIGLLVQRKLHVTFDRKAKIPTDVFFRNDLFEEVDVRSGAGIAAIRIVLNVDREMLEQGVLQKTEVTVDRGRSVWAGMVDGILTIHIDGVGEEKQYKTAIDELLTGLEGYGMYVQYQSPRPPLVNISNVKASLAIEGETRPIALIARDEAEHDMAGTLLKGQYRNIQIVRKLDLERFPWFKDTRFRVAGGKGRVLAGLLWGIPTLFIQGLENDPEKQAKAVEELSTELHAVKIRDEAAAEAKDVTGKAAILPEDAAPYYLRALRISGFLERAGIARTPAMSAARAVSLLLNSWKETDPLLRDPEWFDQGAADPERSKLIRHAWAAAWLGMADLAGAAIVLTVLSPSLAAWVAVPGIVSLAISLLLHTRYDMHAEVPTAIVIKNRPSDITGVPREKEYATIEIVKELDDESQKGLLHNTGFKVDGNYVWAGMIHDSLTLFVEGVPAERSGQAMDRVIDTLKGFANVQGNGRAIAVLQSLDADFSPVDSAIVYDFTGGMVKVRAGRDEALEFSREELPSYGALRNVLRAHDFALAREIAIESRWSAGYRDLEALNGSIVLEQKDIENNARVEGIAELRNKGAKIYVKYEGDSQAELEELLKTYRLDGALVVRGNGTDGAEVNSDEIVQNVNSSVDLVLSGPNVKGERGRGYVELDLGNPLDVQRIEDRKIQPGTVVKVKVDDDSIRKIEQLNKLPGNVILVFEGAEYRELSRITGRDIMELNLFGVNLLAALRITPQTDEEKQTYEERMAFALEFGDGVNPGEVLRGDKESLAGTVTHILKGEYAKVENGSLALFIESAAAHDRTAADARSFRAAVAARLVLAAQGKQYGLESAGQEDTLVEMMRKLQELGSDFTVEAPAELVRSGTIKGPEFEQLKARAREGKADAVRAVIELLAVNGDQKVVFRAKDLKFEQLNVNAIRSVLEAA